MSSTKGGKGSNSGIRAVREVGAVMVVRTVREVRACAVIVVKSGKDYLIRKGKLYVREVRLPLGL